MISDQEITELFQHGYNCSQIVASYFADKYGYASDDVKKLSCGFGGGMRKGEVCGAVTGAIMVIGLKYGNSDERDRKAKLECYNRTVEFENEFMKGKKTIICRELLGYDISVKDEYENAAKQNIFNKTCPDMIITAIKILEELGY